MVTKRTPAKPTSARRRNGSAKKPAPSVKRWRVPKRRKGEELHDFLIRLGESIPAEEQAKMPVDGAANHDHYIYGAPKQY